MTYVWFTRKEANHLVKLGFDVEILVRAEGGWTSRIQKYDPKKSYRRAGRGCEFRWRLVDEYRSLQKLICSQTEIEVITPLVLIAKKIDDDLIYFKENPKYTTQYDLEFWEKSREEVRDLISMGSQKETE